MHGSSSATTGTGLSLFVRTVTNDHHFFPAGGCTKISSANSFSSLCTLSFWLCSATRLHRTTYALPTGPGIVPLVQVLLLQHSCSLLHSHHQSAAPSDVTSARSALFCCRQVFRSLAPLTPGESGTSALAEATFDSAAQFFQWLNDSLVAPVWVDAVCGDGICAEPYEFAAIGAALVVSSSVFGAVLAALVISPLSEPRDASNTASIRMKPRARAS